MPANFHIRLIEPPAAAYRTLSTPELLLDLRGILDDPAMKCGLIDCHTPLTPHFLSLLIRDRVGTYHLTPHSILSFSA
jgi:hypothetical protein